MSSKSRFYAILYFGVAAIITALFCTDQLGGMLAASGLPAYRADVVAFLAIVAVALVSMAFGGHKQGIVIGATLASFLVLTAHQEQMLVRYISLGAVLFAIGIYGMVTSRNAIRMLISIELLINAANINFLTFARTVDPSEIRGQVFAIFVLTVAAAEAAVGLAIVLAIYRNMSTVDMEKFNLLKW